MLNENGLTPKQQIFADKYIETGNGTTAALEAYNTNQPESAKVIASNALTKFNVRNYIITEAAKYRITPGRIFSKLDKLIDHQKPLMAADGVVKDETGKVIEVDDTGTQLEAVKLAVKVLPQFEECKNKGGGQGSKHLHLKTLPETLLNRFMASDEEEE